LQNFFTSFFLFFLKNIPKYFYITFLSGSCFEPSSDLPFPVPGEDIEPVVVPGDIPGVVPGSEPEYYEQSTFNFKDQTMQEKSLIDRFFCFR